LYHQYNQYVHNAGELWIDSVEWGGTRGWSLFEEAEFGGWRVPPLFGDDDDTMVNNNVGVVNVVLVVLVVLVVNVVIVVVVVVDAFARGLGWAGQREHRRKQIQAANVVVVVLV